MAAQERPAMRALCAIPKKKVPMCSWDWQLGGVETPDVGPGQVLITVVAVGIRRQDLTDLPFYHQLAVLEAKPPLAYVPGMDVAGIVKSKAPDVKSVRVGDAVIAFLDKSAGGGCAEMVVADADRVWPKPSKVCFAEAATLIADGLCAVQAVETASSFMPMHEPNVLVTGPSTGIGVLISQVAKALYSAKITVVYTGESQLEVIEKLTVDDVVEIPADKQIMDVLPPAGFDVAFDTCGMPQKVAKLVKSGGLVISTDGYPPKGSFPKLSLPGSVKSRMKKQQRVVARACYGTGVTHEYILPRYSQTTFQLLMNLRDRSDVCPPYGPVFGMQKWHAGLEVAREQSNGKVVFGMDPKRSVYDAK